MVEVASRRQAEGWICDIEVEDAGEHTKHVVTVSRSELEHWGRGGDVDDLVKRSFEFLLERERPSSILRRFDLSVIQRYFPEYDEQIRAGSSPRYGQTSRSGIDAPIRDLRPQEPHEASDGRDYPRGGGQV